jgi:hypothetical protein
MKGIIQQMREGKILPPYEGSEKLIEAMKEFIESIKEYKHKKPQD